MFRIKLPPKYRKVLNSVDIVLTAITALLLLYVGIPYMPTLSVGLFMFFAGFSVGWVIYRVLDL